MTELERELEANEKMWRATTVLSQEQLAAQIEYDKNRIMRKHGVGESAEAGSKCGGVSATPSQQWHGNQADEAAAGSNPASPTTLITSPVYSPAERTDGFKAR